jgi:hypothetical protein
VPSPGDDYYVSGGRRIRLERKPDLVGVLLEHPAVEGSKLGSTLKHVGRPLRDGIVMAPLSSIPAELREELDDEGALLPVYEQGDSLLVVLPEVRVEGDDPRQLADLKEWLKDQRRGVEVVEERDDRVTLRPTSGRAADALRTANAISEEARSVVSQPRFLRIVPPR